MSLVVAAALLLSPPPSILPDYGATPTVNLSAIRFITCGKTSGTGFLIGDNIIATAAHVVDGDPCIDDKTKKPLTVYYVEQDTDFALAKVELKGIPYLKYDCTRYVTGQGYESYGYSSYMQEYTIFRQSRMTAMNDYSGPLFWVAGKQYSKMRHLFGPMVWGHSGGPVVNSSNGNVMGINNAGNHFFGLATGHSWSTELADTKLCKR